MGNPTDEDVLRFQAESVAACTACVAATKRLVIACPDFRAATLLRPNMAEKIAELMKRDNRNVERSGILAAKSATLTLQLTRLLRESTSESRRRVFTEIEPLFAWLDEALTMEERARLRDFVFELGPEDLDSSAVGIGAPQPVARVTPNAVARGTPNAIARGTPNAMRPAARSSPDAPPPPPPRIRPPRSR